MPLPFSELVLVPCGCSLAGSLFPPLAAVPPGSLVPMMVPLGSPRVMCWELLLLPSASKGVHPLYVEGFLILSFVVPFYL